MRKWLFSMLLIFSLLATVAAAQRESSSPPSVWQQSRQLRLSEVERLKQELARDPENLSLQISLGRIYYWLALDRDAESLAEAEKVFKRVLDRDRDNAQSLAYYGALLGLKIGFSLVPQDQIIRIAQEANASLDRAVSLAPDSIEVREVRGYTSLHTPSYAGRDHLAVEDFSHAITLLENAKASDEDIADVHLALGDAYNKIGERQKARASWQRARDLLPGSLAAKTAQMRLDSNSVEEDASTGRMRELIAFLGFFIGAAIFSILSFLILRDLFKARRKPEGIAASLIVSLLALAWNFASLALLVLNAARQKRHTAWSDKDIFLILSLSTIPVGLFIAHRFYKAAFMDIALKRGAALLALLALSMVYAQLVTIPLRLTILQVQNPALRSIFFNGIWLWIFLLYPAARDRIHQMVDRFVFRRRDYSNLLDWFGERLRGAADEKSLMIAVTDALKEAFRADFARFAPVGDDLVSRLLRESVFQKSDVALRQDIEDDELYRLLEERQIELAVIARSGKLAEGAMMVGARAYGQGYLSEELSALRALAAQVSHALENIRLQESRRRQAVAEEELRKLAAEAELRALRAQIDPHFFFNALNSVASLVNEDPQRAEEMIEDLSDLFRHSLRSGGEFISLGEELDLAETYLKIEKVRLGERLKFRKFISAEAMAAQIPALSIQPIIENAVKHGIEPVSGGGVITLSAAITGNHLIVHISDTGRGIAESRLEEIFSSGVGLSNVNDRLRRLYGEGLRIDSRPDQGTTVSFSVPVMPRAVEAV
ncbi:MAG: histidine kinase [Acidobacteriota bacterium]